MKIISERQRLQEVVYSREFVRKDDPECGFSFPCDQNQKLLPLNEEAIENYQKCINGEYDVIDQGIQKNFINYTDPAIGICEQCGCKVILSRFTNTCDNCGEEYNMSGQRLAPRDQWEEDY